jgi:hypothetical protein
VATTNRRWQVLSIQFTAASIAALMSASSSVAISLRAQDFNAATVK